MADPAEPVVRLAVAGGVATITLDRPRNGNAIDLGLARELMQALHACEGNKGVRAIELRGAGRIFCAGGDLAAIRGQGDQAPAYVRSILAYLHEAISAIARIPAPVVARIHGAAAGAGLALACCCDLVVAAGSSRFLMAYSRVGLTPDGSSTFYLPRLIGLRRTLELALGNRILSATEARDWGLITDVVEDDELAPRLAQLTADLVAGPTAAYGESKRLIRTSLDNNLETQMAREADVLARALTTPEAAEGLSAFRSKRPP